MVHCNLESREPHGGSDGWRRTGCRLPGRFAPSRASRHDLAHVSAFQVAATADFQRELRQAIGEHGPAGAVADSTAPWVLLTPGAHVLNKVVLLAIGSERNGRVRGQGAANRRSRSRCRPGGGGARCDSCDSRRHVRHSTRPVRRFVRRRARRGRDGIARRARVATGASLRLSGVGHAVGALAGEARAWACFESGRVVVASAHRTDRDLSRRPARRPRRCRVDSRHEKCRGRTAPAADRVRTARFFSLERPGHAGRGVGGARLGIRRASGTPGARPDLFPHVSGGVPRRRSDGRARPTGSSVDPGPRDDDWDDRDRVPASLRGAGGDGSVAALATAPDVLAGACSFGVRPDRRCPRPASRSVSAARQPVCRSLEARALHGYQERPREPPAGNRDRHREASVPRERG